MSSGTCTIRMEDVVYTLNNIMDDIDQMYAGNAGVVDEMPLEDVSLDQELTNCSGNPADLPALPSPPNILASPVEDSDVESDSTSISSCSSSPDPSPASSGFTSPSISPTAATFPVDNEITVKQGEVSCLNAQSLYNDVRAVPSVSGASWSDMDGVDPDPSFTIFPSSLAANGNSSITYGAPYSPSTQGSGTPGSIFEPMPCISPPHLTTSPPALPPRPTQVVMGARDPPPHLPALRSPTLPSTPKLDQSEQWTSQLPRAQSERRDLWASYLVKQRQRARMTITRAASLAEPRALAVYLPREQHVYSYTHMSASAPRGRTVGAYNRRVNVAPKVLGKGKWDAWRKGGQLDRATMMEKRRLQVWEDMMEAEQALEAEVIVEKLLTDEHTESGEDSDMVVDQPSSGEEQLSNKTEGEPKVGEEPKSENAGGDADEMQLWVQYGKLVVPTPVVTSSSNSSPNSVSGTESAGSGLCAEEPMPQDPDTIQVYAKDGARVALPTAKPLLNSSASAAPGAPTALPQARTRVGTAALLQPGEPLDKYAPRAKSPLGQLPIIPPRVGRLHIPGEASSAGRAWRKFASMMF